MFEKKRRKRLERAVEIGMTYGVYVFYKKYDKDVWCSRPQTDAERTAEKRYEAARNSVEALSNKDAADVKKALRWMETCLRNYLLKEQLLARIEEASVREIRTEIMVELYRSGREEHPLYAELAAASSMTEMRNLRRRVAEETRKELVLY